MTGRTQPRRKLKKGTVALPEDAWIVLRSLAVQRQQTFGDLVRAAVTLLEYVSASREAGAEILGQDGRTLTSHTAASATAKGTIALPDATWAILRKRAIRRDVTFGIVVHEALAIFAEVQDAQVPPRIIRRDRNGTTQDVLILL